MEAGRSWVRLWVLCGIDATNKRYLARALVDSCTWLGHELAVQTGCSKYLFSVDQKTKIACSVVMFNID